MTTSDIHIQISAGPALMQPADFLPFVNQNIASINEALLVRSKDILSHRLYGKLTPAEELERLPKVLATLWHGQIMSGFFQEHYPVGAVFDYHGVPAMVESTEADFTGLRRTQKVNACVRSGNGGIEHLTISEDLALALVWKKFGLEEA